MRNRAKTNIFGLALLSSILVVFLIFAGCGGDKTSTPVTESKSESTDTATSVEYTIEVFRNGGKVASLSLPDLQSLPQKSVQTIAGMQEGPTVLSVLQQVGIQEFNRLVISGLTRHRIESAELTLTRAEINDQVILDITGQGTTKLTSPDIPQEEWIIDVNRLTVE